MDVFQRGTQLGVNGLIEILHEGIGEAGLIGQGGDVALIIGPLIHGEGDDVAAVDTACIDGLHNRCVNAGVRVSGDEGELFVHVIGFHNLGEHIHNRIRGDVRADVDTEVRIRMLHDILSGHFAQPREYFLILEGHPRSRLETKITHCKTPSVTDLRTHDA